MKDYIDPSELYAENTDSWRDIWDSSDSIYANTYRLINSVVALPNPEIQLPLAAVYLWTNPKWSRVLPILFCYGIEGSGKSTLTRLAGYLRRSTIFGQNSTFASIRNYLADAKYLDEEREFESDGAILLFDNVYSSTLINDKNLLSLFLSGFNKSDDRITIANAGTGTNYEFRTFSSRIVSSVEALHAVYELRELKRRMLVLFHQRWELLSPEDKERFDFENRLELDAINWDGFEGVYHKFWGQKANCLAYVQARKGCRKPAHIPSEKWEFCKDLVATGLVISAWDTHKKAYSILGDYFAMADKKMGADETPLEQFISDLIKGLSDPTQCPNSLVLSWLTTKVSNKELTNMPQSKEIAASMAKLGFKQDRGIWKALN